MKILALVLLGIALISCAQTLHKSNLQERVSQHNAQHLFDVKDDLTYLLQSHAGLSAETKEKIQSTVMLYLDRHEALKQEESKIIAVLLSDSLGDNAVTKREAQKALKELYQRKASNMAQLLDEIETLAAKNTQDLRLRSDMRDLLREVR